MSPVLIWSPESFEGKIWGFFATVILSRYRYVDRYYLLEVSNRCCRVIVYNVQEERDVIPNHTVYSLNVERIIMRLHHEERSE
jgi:hypothetical protein